MTWEEKYEYYLEYYRSGFEQIFALIGEFLEEE